jgi:hypothetical protein
VPHPVSTKTHATNPHHHQQQQTTQRRGAHPRSTPQPAAPISARARRALDINLTPEQKAEVLAMTPAERVDAMLEGRLTLGQETFWSRTHQAQVPLIGNELAYIARYDPEYCETGEKQARP